jgi:hypothetical protein
VLGNRRVDAVRGDGAPPPAIDTPRAPGRRQRGAKGAAAIGDDDLGDIETILRKHGIS